MRVGTERCRNVVVLAPVGGDGPAISRQLGELDLVCRVVDDAPALIRAMDGTADLAIVTEEALDPSALARLAGWMREQPEWSELPVVLLGTPRPVAGQLVKHLREVGRSRVTLLERPLRVEVLVAAVRTGLAARARQLQVRDELERRRRAEAALRESEERFRLMADELPNPIWVHDPAGRQIHVNRTFRRFFGRSIEAPGEGAWPALIHPEDAERNRKEFFAALRDRRPFHATVRARRADGEWRWLESWGEPRFAADGRYLGHIGTSADVTDREQAQQALREKTVELEAVDRRKDQFLATLGHELRNPLAALDLALRLLEEGTGDAERLRLGMRTQVDQLTRLVNDLLEVSRITRGKLTLDLAPLDLVPIVHRALSSVEGRIGAKRIGLTLRLPERLPVEGDAMRLEQVLANLLANAAEYTSPDGHIEVVAAREDEEVRLSVRDTGRGLSIDQLETIFEPFVQVDPLGGGLGLGLALVRSLVELHGGSVRAESDGPGRGAVFRLRLPATSCTAPEPPRPERGGRLDRAVRVLVVDDNRDFADSLASVLRTMGAEPVCAYTGGDGLERARESRPELALVDLGLPDVSGFDVARALRGFEGGEGMRLVAVTGFGDRSSSERAREAGFEDLLLKPVDRGRLRALLRERAEAAEPAPPERLLRPPPT